MEGTANKEKPQGGSSSQEIKQSQSSKGTLRKLWGWLGHLSFWHTSDDFEKRLQHLSKEEVTVHTRLKRRSQTWRKLARALVLYSVAGEVLVLGIAIMATRSPGIPWQMRALRVFPVFALPALSALLYSSCAGYCRMRERKDQKTLERLRAERQAKIDELKRKTNYYLTQQLIQKYDLDPTAKAAAASVLAAKLGAEAGINVTFKASELLENDISSSSAKLDASVTNTTGLKKRVNSRTSGIDYPVHTRFSEGSGNAGLTGDEGEDKGMKVAVERGFEAEQYRRRPSEGGWLSRIAAMLVGEDPSQCYALICKKCHMHNGLAPKEDFQYVTYFCPYCHTLNGNPKLGEGGDVSDGAGKDTLRALNNVIEELSTPCQALNADVALSGSSEPVDADLAAAVIKEASNKSPTTEGIGL
ncbi:hypothetical protein O6H91_09G058500 [Diphasiastrum complanatum]|uniref:Uncharacterized protein n=6 Tax=Diphasiastrum complanatum TaxID=34168 RepID=A0ACC2CPV6_DIPCM|nr:hypothetical protein O6H91_Y446700 [Diphasiastrum complanatum]KAJ7298737.1 hypothetical protein O6H91_Y446700 [Diphasiastrum complanatum]KAJ7298738.1 hypothetical protein O6H91_Y446700 [Diphasiastrum complanatum]KAJ7298739.1 hypothetical protein O6H91_Y446700 [Diphasiastrum complanatum]KAJ7543922.1 hypothetical protein O6H91_09G058500 [Diphasiastrum complanatum]